MDQTTNFFPPLLFAAGHGLNMLGVIEPWGDVSREMILIVKKTIDVVLFKGSASWMELMAADGVMFEHGEEDEWAITAVLRGVKCFVISGNVLYIFLFSIVLMYNSYIDSYLPFYFVHIQRMLNLHYYGLSVFRLNK